jgi:hypothetical protein
MLSITALSMRNRTLINPATDDNRLNMAILLFVDSHCNVRGEFRLAVCNSTTIEKILLITKTTLVYSSQLF